MRCPHCGHTETRVVETREAEDAVRRRRECEACHLRFTTYERPQFPRLVVRATNGAQRTFTRGWLAVALAAAGAELPEPAIKTIVSTIEAQLRAGTRRVVLTTDVAALAAREVALALPRSTPTDGGVTPDRVALLLDASMPARRAGPSQLPLPIEGRG